MEAFAIYDVMMYVKPPIRTLCVGTAFGEAAMLLAAGSAGLRGALPSATIMLRQPIQRFERMQASDIDIYRNELRCAPGVALLFRACACLPCRRARHTGSCSPWHSCYFGPVAAQFPGVYVPRMRNTSALACALLPAVFMLLRLQTERAMRQLVADPRPSRIAARPAPQHQALWFAER
jgi:hypothetical protein